MWFLILALCVSLFHWRGLQPGYTFLPVDLANNNLPRRSEERRPLQNSLISDPLYQFYPFLNEAILTIRHEHAWPLWNPNIMLGHPSLGDPLAQPFYPVLLGLGLIVGPGRGFTLGLWLQAILAASLVYGWLRAVRCSRIAAVAGAITYALGGYMVTWFETTFWLSTLAWLPGVLWAYELALQKQSLRFAAVAAAAMGLAILGGQFQFALVFTIVFGLYALGRALEMRLEQSRVSLSPIVVYLIIVALGVLLSGILLLPATEFLGVSRRIVERGLNDPLPWQQFITLIVPNFYGNPAKVASYWGVGNFSEGTIYAGVVALLPACIAPLTQKRFFTRFIALVTLVVIYFIIGGPGVSALGSLPGFKYASLHRTTFILPLLMAYLAAQTLSATIVSARLAGLISAMLLGIVLLALYMDLGEARSHWTFLRHEVSKAALLLALALCLLWIRARFSRYRDWAQWGLATLIFVDLFVFGSRFNPAGPIQHLMPDTASIDFLKKNVTQRVVALQRNDEVLFGPNVLSLSGLAEAGGYSSIVISRYHQLVSAADPELDVWWMNRGGNMMTFSNPSLRLLDLFQVSHLVSPVPIDISSIRGEIQNGECSQTSQPITREHPVRGRFVVHEAAINRLDFRLQILDPIRARTSNLMVRLWQGSDNGRLVLETQQAVPAASEQGWLVVFFAPEKNAPGQTYVWEISTDAAHTGTSLCLGANGQPAIRVYGSDWTQVYQDDVFIYERLAPLPRAYVVYAAEHIERDASAVERLLDAKFSIRHSAVTARAVPLPATPDIPATPARIVGYEDTRVVVTAHAERQGLLVLGDQFYPGWQVTVDGRRAPLLRANHIFRAVLLPAGEHEVVFEFRSRSLSAGGLLSAIGVILMILVAVLDCRIPYDGYGQRLDRATV
ncbi:MAG TPA: YfhO family protein [Anaerolineae bacterium]